MPKSYYAENKNFELKALFDIGQLLPKNEHIIRANNNAALSFANFRKAFYALSGKQSRLEYGCGSIEVIRCGKLIVKLPNLKSLLFPVAIFIKNFQVFFRRFIGMKILKKLIG